MNQVEFELSGEVPFWEMNYEEGDPECKHPLPGDWIFGGATEEDPRTDPRWQPMVFVFMDRMLRQRHMSSVPRCIHEAKGSFKEWVERTLDVKIFYITAALPGDKGEIIYQDTEGAVSAS